MRPTAFASSPPRSRIPAGPRLPARPLWLPSPPTAAKAGGASPGSRPRAGGGGGEGGTWAPSPRSLEAPGAGLRGILQEPFAFQRREMPLPRTATAWGYFSNFGDTWCSFRQGLSLSAQSHLGPHCAQAPISPLPPPVTCSVRRAPLHLLSRFCAKQSPRGCH